MAHGRKTGGRQKGTPNKATTEARALCHELLRDPVYRATLAVRLNSGEIAPHVEILMWHYAYGKPADVVELSGPDGEAIPIQQLADDQLNSRIAELERQLKSDK